jgi:membrane-associated phospholipid phosphatase
VLTLMVCLGRVLALVHTPLDVIGGIVVASVGALWYLQRDNSTAKTNSGRKDKKVVQ